MIDTLESQELHFRIIQMVWEGYRWVDEWVDFYPLLEGREGHNLGEFFESYKLLLRKRDYVPDVILVAGWPHLCMVARWVVTDMKLNTKIISWLHNPIERYEAAGYGGLNEIRFADAHFAINSEIHRELFRGAVGQDVYRLHNPVHFSAEHSIINRQNLERRLLFVGRLYDQKNLDYVFKTLRRINWKVRIVGTGEEEERLRQLSADLSLEGQIEWVGWSEEPWKYCNEVDALVMSSFYEGFPLTALEALSRGIPVISSKVSGIKEIIKNGENGYLFDVYNEDGLFEILSDIEKQGYVIREYDKCFRSALPYEKSYVFYDMKMKIEAIVTGTRLRPNTIGHPYFLSRSR